MQHYSKKLVIFTFLGPLLFFILQALYYVNFYHAEENHYLWVAYSMFSNHQWIVLHDTAGFYLNKPPLLFWLLSIFWKLFSLHSWTVNLLLTCILLTTLCLAEYLIRLLFRSRQTHLHWSICCMMLSCLFFWQRSLNLAFDTLVVTFSLLGFIGIVQALNNKRIGYLWLGIAMGCTILTKGPIGLSFILSFLLVASFFRHVNQVSLTSWLIGGLISLLITCSIVSAWLLPLLSEVGMSAVKTLLLTKASPLSYGHKPFYFYSYELLLMLIPLLLWPFATTRLLKNITFLVQDKQQWRERLLFFSWLVSFIVLSIIPPKAPRYIMTWMFLICALYFSALKQYQSEFKPSFFQGRYLNTVLIFIAITVLLIVLIQPTLILSHIHSATMTQHVIIICASVLLVGNLALLLLPSSVTNEVFRYAGISALCLLSFYVIPNIFTSLAFPSKPLAITLNKLQQQGYCIEYQKIYGGFLYHVGNTMIPHGGQNPSPCKSDKPYYLVRVWHPGEPKIIKPLVTYRHPNQAWSIVVEKREKYTRDQ